jgi:hypothetical protein
MSLSVFRLGLLGAAALSFATASVAQQPVNFSTHGKVHGLARGATDRSLSVLYDQTSNDSGFGTFSQNGYGPSTAAADDFVVPRGTTWIVKEVDVTGIYFNGSGPATENVTFYADKRGKVGDVVAAFSHVNGADNFGSFAITLGTRGQKLKSGHYWLSVVANLNSAEWVWENQTTTEGDPAMWESPGSGGACETWALESECVGSPGDHVFVLKGKAK